MLSLSTLMHEVASGEDVIDIPMWKLGIIAALLVFPLTVAGVAGLHVNRPLVLAGVRCLVQLLLLGGVLRVIFANGSLLWVAAYIVFMMTVASIEAGSRPSMSYKVCPARAVLSSSQGTQRWTKGTNRSDVSSRM